METEVLATLLGVALAALVAACGAGLRVLSGRLDRLDNKLDRLEAKVDSLIMALARSGVLVHHPPTEPRPPHPPTLEAGGGGVA